MPKVKCCCKTCKKEFFVYLSTSKGLFCSNECYNVTKKQAKDKVCLICNKSFYVHPAFKNQKYCSRSCAGKRIISYEERKKLSLIRKNFYSNNIERIKQGKRSKKTWKLYREKIIKSIFKINTRISSYEQKFIDLIKKHSLPYKYVGQGKVIIGGLVPDFININGNKIIVETYCKFYHPSNYEKRRFKIFEKFGYYTIFLTDEDLNGVDWEEKCLKKIF